MTDDRLVSVTSHLLDALSALLETGQRGGLPEGMADTPSRVARAWVEMTGGYGQDPGVVLGRTFPADGYDEIVALSAVPFTSLCEHHLMPFAGEADLAYIPGPRVVGLSKLARLVDVFARRFQIQERMTKQIADAMETHLATRGCAVVVRATHTCMTARGVQKHGAVMTTSDIRGLLRDKPEARAEALDLLARGRRP